jgi:hypothetical protein
MAHFAIAADAFKACLRSRLLWLIQFFANLLLFGLFAGWLLLPVANTGYLILNILLAGLFLLAVFVLHGGTLNYFYSQSHNENATLSGVFARALRNFLALAVCAGAVYLLWVVVGKADAYQETLPAYLSSITPMFLRKHISLAAFQEFFGTCLFALRWILLPGLVLPFLASVSRLGFRGFGLQGFTAWKTSLRSTSYWGVMVLSALLGVLATEKIMQSRPDFRTSSFNGEIVSLIFRGLVSYLLGLFAWLLVCSAVGRSGRNATKAPENIRGQAAA